MQADLKSGFRLGPWEVRPLTGEISGPSGIAHLEPKVMEVLAALAAQPGQVVERDTLLREVWGSRATVSDEPLTRCIAELRRALGDSRQTPTYIQTVPKRGYRLLCEVLPLAGDDLAASRAPSVDPEFIGSPGAAATTESRAPATRALLRPRLIAAAFLALASGLVLAIFLAGESRPRIESSDIGVARNTIAVLPFANIDEPGENGEYFSEGLADEILNRLNAVEGLRVVSRTSSFSFRDSTHDVPSIARLLRVAYVLEGSVRRSGEQVRISAQLIDGEGGYPVWSDSYEGVIADIFGLQDAIANAIVERFRALVAIDMPTDAIATTPPTRNMAAYELLLRGRQYLNRREEQPLRRSIDLFQQALRLDENYGQAYVELAKAYALLPSYSSELQEEMFDLSRATLISGVERDSSVEAAMQAVLGLIAYAQWDWIDAEIAFRRALSVAAKDPDLLLWHSQFLASVGKPEQSLQQALRAKELDLLSPVVNHRLAVALMWTDDDEGARRQFAIAADLGMGPTANPDAHIVMRLRLSEYGEVRPMLLGVQAMFARPTAWIDPLLAALEQPSLRPYAVSALAQAERDREISPKYLFGAWIYLDELERSVNTGLRLVHDRPSFNVEFLFSREASQLRAHPRFGELVQAIGLHRYWDQFGWPDMCRRSGDGIACN